MGTKFRITTAGGETVEVETDCGTSLKEVLQTLREEGYNFGSKLSAGGQPIDDEYIPEEGEVVETHDTPAGN